MSKSTSSERDLPSITAAEGLVAGTVTVFLGQTESYSRLGPGSG